MKNILLVCNAGMSTSMLVKKMQTVATELNMDVNIEAKPLTEAKMGLAGVDIILLGPQIRYEKANVEKIAGDIPVVPIDMRDYGTMNGKKVLETAMSLLGE